MKKTHPIGDGPDKSFFRAEEVHIVPKVWGEEHWIVNKEYCGKKLVLRKNMRCSVHQHKEKDEVFYVLKGKVLLELGKKNYTMNVGDFVHVARNTPHRFTGLEDSEIMEFSTTHKEEDSYRLTQSGHVEQARFDREAATVDRFKDVSVLVIGDVMLDMYVEGKVDRVSPEAPIPVVQYRGEFQVPGGAANAARNVSSLGGKATVIGVIGTDAYGKTLARLLKKEGVASLLLTDASRHTIRKQRIMSGDHQMLRLDYEAVHPLSSVLQKKLMTTVATALKKADVLLLSDYAKGLFSPETLTHCIALAKKAGVPVILDPKPKDASYLAAIRGVDLLTPNKKEAEILAGNVPPEEACAVLAQRLKTNVLVTLGEAGMLLHANKKTKAFPALTHDVADVSGAGDTVAATLALCLGCDAEMEDAADLANRAASIVVRKPGTATASQEELRRTL